MTSLMIYGVDDATGAKVVQCNARFADWPTEIVKEKYTLDVCLLSELRWDGGCGV